MPNIHMRLYALISLCKILSLRNRRLATPSCSARPPPADKERADQGRAGLHLHRQGREIIQSQRKPILPARNYPSIPTRELIRTRKLALGSMAGWAQLPSTIVGAMKEITHSLSIAAQSLWPRERLSLRATWTRYMLRFQRGIPKKRHLTLKEHYLWHSRYSFFLYR
jgi:hypothetical protein